MNKDVVPGLEPFQSWDNRPWGEPWIDNSKVITTAGEISEIGLARSMCYGMCPVYDLTLTRSGDARFDGQYFVSLMGLHTASLKSEEFADLARAIVFLEFLSFEPRYEFPITDVPTFTMWIRLASQRVVVSRRGARGPAALSVLEELIDGCAATLNWRPFPTERQPVDDRPIFVGSKLEPGDLPGGRVDDRVHWTQRPRQTPPSE